jgi:DNA mismatch repair ATPase MutS
MDQKEKYYSGKLETLNEVEIAMKKELRWLALFRLLSFIFLIISIFVLLPENILLGAFTNILLLILFFILIKKYRKKNNQHEHTKALININKDELKALKHNYSTFGSGEEFIDHSHPFSYDMDLFGDGSLFQYLNRTVTHKGRKNLAYWLANENLDPGLITDRQDAVKELSDFNELMQDFRACGASGSDSEEDIFQLNSWVDKPVYYLHRPIWKWLVNLLPVFTVFSVVAAFYISGFFNVFIILFLTQFIVTGIRIKHTTAEHALIGKRLEALKKYYELLLYVEKKKFTNSKLNKIYQQLFTDQYSAAISIKGLSKIVASFDARLNFVAAIFLEGFLLWDIRCMIQLEKWKSNQGHHLNDWIGAIAEFDTFISLATYTFNHPGYTYPVYSEDKMIEARDMGHALIPADQRVCNHFEIAASFNFVIVTGANMAGKSTFLRTVTTNMVLAMAGAPVCASSFIFRPMKIFSSMRTSDSLNKNESYFYAELKRLKEMLDKLRAGEKIFIVLDEILKGTNSVDKQKGSKAVLEQIINFKGTGIIATHDLELTKAQEKYPDRIQNMCFEIEIDQAKISFDYKIRTGVTTKMNASILMKQMGIVMED